MPVFPINQIEHAALVDKLLEEGQRVFDEPLGPEEEVVVRIIQRFGHSLSHKQVIDLCVVLDDRYEHDPERVLWAIRRGVLEEYAESHPLQ